MNHTLNTSTFRKACKFSTAPRFRQQANLYCFFHLGQLILNTTQHQKNQTDQQVSELGLVLFISILWRLLLPIVIMFPHFQTTDAVPLQVREENVQHLDQLYMTLKSEQNYHLLMLTTVWNLEARAGRYVCACQVKQITQQNVMYQGQANMHRYK